MHSTFKSSHLWFRLYFSLHALISCFESGILVSRVSLTWWIMGLMSRAVKSALKTVGGGGVYRVVIKYIQGHPGGSVSWASDFGSGHDLAVCEFKPHIGTLC